MLNKQKRWYRVYKWWVEEWDNKKCPTPKWKNTIYSLWVPPHKIQHLERENFMNQVLVTYIILDCTRFWEVKTRKTTLKGKWGRIKIYLLTLSAHRLGKIASQSKTWVLLGRGNEATWLKNKTTRDLMIPKFPYW